MWATEDIIVHGIGVSMSFVFAWVPLVPLRSPSSNMEWLRRLTLGCTNSWGTLSLGNSQSYKGTASKHSQLCPRRKHYLYYPGQETSLPSAQEGGPISILQGSLLCRYPWKDSSRPKLSQTSRNMQSCTPQHWISSFSVWLLHAVASSQLDALKRGRPFTWGLVSKRAELEAAYRHHTTSRESLLLVKVHPKFSRDRCKGQGKELHLSVWRQHILQGSAGWCLLTKLPT